MQMLAIFFEKNFIIGVEKQNGIEREKAFEIAVFGKDNSRAVEFGILDGFDQTTFTVYVDEKRCKKDKIGKEYHIDPALFRDTQLQGEVGNSGTGTAEVKAQQKKEISHKYDDRGERVFVEVKFSQLQVFTQNIGTVKHECDGGQYIDQKIEKVK